jgi:hypothetical protein
MQSTSTYNTTAGGSGHVLLVSPRTFSYEEVICSALREMGYRVTWWNERASNATWYKLALRLAPGLTSRLSTSHFLRKLQALPHDEITHVLVIKGEGVSRKVIEAMRQRMAAATMSYYLWDGVDNVPGAVRIADCFDAVATFDPVDAIRFGWHHRPLFARHSAAVPRAKPPEVGAEFDWCFIGTLHSDRHRVIHRLRRAAGASSRSFVLGFSPSRAMMWVRRVTDWTLWLAPAGTVSTHALPAAEVLAVVARSRAVLDVEHPRQRGLTMRTIETLMAGQKLVTTNARIVESDLFHPTRVHVVSRQSPDIPEDFFAAPFEPIGDKVRRRYTCQGWALELIMLAEAGRRGHVQSPVEAAPAIR